MSERERDLKFEVQYILSLALVVFGLLSVQGVRESVDVWTAYPVILFLAIHLSVFTLIYGIGQTGLTVDLVETIEELPIFSLIGVAFVLFISHSVLAVGYDHITEIRPPLPLQWEIVIKYVAPIILVSTMGYSVKRRGYDPISEFDGVNIKVVPEFIRVFPSPGDSKALLVKVENNGGETFDYVLNIDVPDIVTLHRSGEAITDQFTEVWPVESGRADRYSFDLSHISDEHSAEEIEVVVDSGGASFSTTIELELAI